MFVIKQTGARRYGSERAFYGFGNRVVPRVVPLVPDERNHFLLNYLITKGGITNA